MPFVGQGQSVNLDYLLQLITEDPVTFNYNVKLQIEAGKANSGKNAQGWLRTGTYYFKQLLKQCSYAKDFLSDSNIKKINKGISPIVDDVFINYFLSKGKDYTACRDEKLVHHHIGEDGQAIFMPESVHRWTNNIHTTEDKIEVTPKAKEHSKKIQEAYEAGYIQAGNDVWFELENGTELRTIAKNKFEYIQELRSEDELLSNFPSW